MDTYDENLLLRALPSASIKRLAEDLVIINTPTHAELYGPGDMVNRIYFPLDSVISMTAPLGATQGEVATVGQEGMIGLPTVFGTEMANMRFFVQIGGRSAVMTADRFTELLRSDDALRTVMLRYAHAMFTQIGQSVVCNQRHSLRQRCARWLLMTHDRVPGDQFHLTHEALAVMLGVRRAGVTVAAGNLQRAGLIRYRRGEITIVDREGLEKVSCECYRLVADVYDRLVGQTGYKESAA
ncbi:MAG TPA: Crp/Fnr family transcriptional regulator [Gemmatimonadaceae bacterium]|nr:Crp/Fnr family transcriptional regulator [Gemmatimonadaceae bacterium]